jgi:hypothetical protein
MLRAHGPAGACPMLLFTCGTHLLLLLPTQAHGHRQQAHVSLLPATHPSKVRSPCQDPGLSDMCACTHSIEHLSKKFSVECSSPRSTCSTRLDGAEMPDPRVSFSVSVHGFVFQHLFCCAQIVHSRRDAVRTVCGALWLCHSAP